ncbi:MAG: GTPase, partial [Planctomycetota bacterium]
TGAVAVIEVRASADPDAVSLLRAFSADPPRDLSLTPINRILFGRWRGEDIVVIRTDVTVWEIHCHGGLMAVNQILGDLEAAGAMKPVATTECLDAGTVTESEVDSHLESMISQCRTRKCAGIALAQSDGRLKALWKNLHSPDPLVRSAAKDVAVRWRHVADHLVQPWRVALVGAPNAGKSSLMNAISGRNRAIVSDVPGTTRDLLEADVFLEGWPFVFVDSAGIRVAAGCELEQSGIEFSRQLASSADVTCVVVDQSQPDEVSSLLKMDRERRICMLLNKCDLQEAHRSSIHVDLNVPAFQVSAVTGQGIPEFLAWLVRCVIPEDPDPDTTLPILPRRCLDGLLIQ